MGRREKRFYSEAFKRQVVQEYEQGASAAELRRRYDIRGNGTLQRWIRRYGREPYREGAVYVQTAADRQRLRRLEEELSGLRKLVAELSLENRMLRASLEVQVLEAEVLEEGALEVGEEKGGTKKGRGRETEEKEETEEKGEQKAGRRGEEEGGRP